MKNATLGTVIIGLAMAATADGQESQRVYEQRGEDIILLENGQEFVVDQDVITVRFKDHRALHQATLDGPLKNCELVRSNRLQIHDLKIPSGTNPVDFVAELEATGLFDFAEVNALGTLYWRRCSQRSRL